MQKTSCLALLLIILVQLIIVACASNTNNQTNIWATVNDQAITQPVLDREIKVSRLNVNHPLPPLSKADLSQARQEALNQLITRYLIVQAAHQQGFVLDDTEINQRVELLFGVHDELTWQTALQQANLTQADVHWWVEQVFTAEEFIAQVIQADVLPEERQAVYNNWLNQQRLSADIQLLLAEQSVYAETGKLAPNFTLPDMNGQPVTLTDYRGQVVLINIWATWCATCLIEMPAYEQVYQQYQKEFVILGINYQEATEQVKQYTHGLGVSYPVLLDEAGDVINQHYRVTGMPSSLLIDQHGIIIYQHIGPMSKATLLEKLAELDIH